MPNHITNVLTHRMTNVVSLSGDKQQINDLINGIKKDDSNFCFAAFAPEPNTFPKNEEKPFEYMSDRYFWRLKNWGTKWDAYEVSQWIESDGQFKISFLTAWATPLMAIETLSKLYPKVQINVRFADEDTGSNVGQYQLLNGEVNFEEILKYGEESIKLAESIYQEADELFNAY